jgi:iron complex outermembrane receptor protein
MKTPLSVKPLVSSMLGCGFIIASPLVFADANTTSVTSTTNSSATSTVNVGEVNTNVKTNSYLGSAQAKTLTQKNNFRSGQSMVVLGKHQIAAAGPVAGSAQALSLVPGLSVASYGNTGASKNSISLNGLKQGWGGFTHGQKNGGTLSVTFDGVPMVDPSTGLWESPEVSQMGVIQGINVTYGPGDPQDRWYNNIGGQINFVPLQPTEKPGAKIKLTYGSYNQKNLFFDIRTGNIDGWSTVLAGGAGNGDSYRTSPVDGFSNPYYDYAWYLKTRKTFSNGDFSAGAYLSKGTAYRPVDVPVNNIGGVYVNGTSGQYYSQQSSGFYSALPYSEWYKQDSNTTWLLYSKLNVALDSTVGLHNMVWYRYGHRLHQHYYGPYIQGLNAADQEYEYNNPHDDVYGDKLWFSLNLPYNAVSFGGFFLNSRYNSRNQFYNPSLGGSIALPDGKYRNDVWNQTDLAAFLQDRISPISTLHITPGVRFINYQTSYTPGSNIPGATGTNQAILGASSKSFTKVEPSVNFNWNFLPGVALFASYAQAFKEPSVGGGGGLYQAIAPIYSLEKSADYNAGLKVHFKNAPYLHHAFATVSFYHLNYSDEFGTLYDAQGNFLGSSLADAIYQGVNISLEDNPIYALHLFANIGFEEAKYTHYSFTNKHGVPSSFSGLPVANVPDSTLDIGAYYKYFVSGILLKPSIWYQYNGAQNMYDNNIGAPSSLKIPAYGVLNLGFGTTIPTRGSFPMLKAVKLHLDVLNVADNHYNASEYISSGGLLGGNSAGEILAQPGAPMTIYGSISASF